MPTIPASDAPEALPPQCQVLVIGAGPAGSACAQWLARAGVDVVLVDQHAFPRDKVCGDGLIPDAHAALQRLGVLDEVLAAAQPVQQVACVAPRGGRIEVPGRLAVLPRRELDHIVCRAAVRAGARLLAPARFEAPLCDAGLETNPDAPVHGAQLLLADGTAHEIRADWVVLATGAVPQALIAAGLCERREPSAVALRGYVRHPGMVGRIRAMEGVWHKRLRAGYGWIFPAPGGVFNIGVGLMNSHVRRGTGTAAMRDDVNLRALFDAFCEVHEPARELMAGGTLLGPLKGAPLRCSLTGARWSRPGLLVTGEAVGSTYAFTGEGIGKALETGLLAAEAVLSAVWSQPRGADRAAIDSAVRARYEASVAALKPRFGLYERANLVNDHPWLADLLVWRARRNPGIRRRMAGVLEETHNPGHLVTARGLMRLMLPIR